MLSPEFNVVHPHGCLPKGNQPLHTFSFLLSRQKVPQRSSPKLSTARRQLGPLVYSSASRSASILSSCCPWSSLDYLQWPGPFCCKAWSACSTASSQPVGPTSLVTSVPLCFQREEQGMFAASSAAGLPRAGSGPWWCRNEGRAVLDAQVMTTHLCHQAS